MLGWSGRNRAVRAKIAEMTSVMPDLETALLITVPDMPKVVQDTRLRLDPGAAPSIEET